LYRIFCDPSKKIPAYKWQKIGPTGWPSLEYEILAEQEVPAEKGNAKFSVPSRMELRYLRANAENPEAKVVHAYLISVESLKINGAYAEGSFDFDPSTVSYIQDLDSNTSVQVPTW